MITPDTEDLVWNTLIAGLFTAAIVIGAMIHEPAALLITLPAAIFYEKVWDGIIRRRTKRAMRRKP